MVTPPLMSGSLRPDSTLWSHAWIAHFVNLGAVVHSNVAFLAVVGAIAAFVICALVQNGIDCVDDDLALDRLRLYICVASQYNQRL